MKNRKIITVFISIIMLTVIGYSLTDREAKKIEPTVVYTKGQYVKITSDQAVEIMKKEKIINWIKKSKFLNRVYLSTVGLLNKNSDYNILEDDLKYTKKYFRRWMLLIYIMLLIPFVSIFVIPGYNAINSYLSSGEIPEIKIENGHLKADKILFKQFNKAFGIIINTNEKLNFKEAVTGNLNGKGFTFAELEEYKKASVLGNTPVVVLVTKDTIALKVSDSVSPVFNLED